jgi:hypothetical protein
MRCPGHKSPFPGSSNRTNHASVRKIRPPHDVDFRALEFSIWQLRLEKIASEDSAQLTTLHDFLPCHPAYQLVFQIKQHTRMDIVANTYRSELEVWRRLLSSQTCTWSTAAQAKVDAPRLQIWHIIVKICSVSVSVLAQVKEIRSG